jgi:hypothetical protein
MKTLFLIALACGAVAGSYSRYQENTDATITIGCVDASTVRVDGVALWGTDHESPHTGEIAFAAKLENGVVQWQDPDGDPAHRYSITLRFGEDDDLVVTEENAHVYLGMNVAFTGDYTKDAKPPK